MIVGPDGREYASQIDICNAYGIKQDVYSKRIKRGWTVAQAVGVELRDNKYIGQKFMQKCGQYLTIVSYRAYKDIDGVFDDGTAVTNIRMTEVLSGKVPNPSLGNMVRDHKGNMFRNRQEMFEYWGVSESAFDARTQRGWSLEKSLETPSKQKTVPVVYLGKTYSSVAELARHLNVTTQYIRHRLDKGYDIDNIMQPIADRMQEYVGKQFKNKIGILGKVTAVYRDKRHRTRFDIVFEDGLVSTNLKDVRNLDKGEFSHPNITATKYSNADFLGFKLLSLEYVLNGEYNFRCKCPDGSEDILSFDEIRSKSLIQV